VDADAGGVVTRVNITRTAADDPVGPCSVLQIYTSDGSSGIGTLIPADGNNWQCISLGDWTEDSGCVLSTYMGPNGKGSPDYPNKLFKLPTKLKNVQVGVDQVMTWTSETLSDQSHQRYPCTGGAQTP
jgi:hypothetical protein